MKTILEYLYNRKGSIRSNNLYYIILTSSKYMKDVKQKYHDVITSIQTLDGIQIYVVERKFINDIIKSLKTISKSDNFVTILSTDKDYDSIKYNIEHDYAGGIKQDNEIVFSGWINY